MATYKSDQVINEMPIPSHGYGDAVHCQRFKVTVGAAMTTADVIQFGNLPDYAKVVDMTIKASDMDTGSAAITLNVGDAGSATRYFSGSTVAQAGTAARMTAATGFGYQYGQTGNANMILGAVAVNPATGVAGTIELLVFYTIEDAGVGSPA